MIDRAVLLIILAGTGLSLILLWRRAVRGRRLFVATWFAFFGLVLVTMMTAHNAEILYHLVRGDVSFISGVPLTYDFHVYSLFLLGVVLTWQGVRSLQAAVGLSRGSRHARRDAWRSRL